MKKILFLTLVFGALFSATSNAQVGGDQSAKLQKQNQKANHGPAPTLQEMKDRIKPQMVAKTGLTEAQVEKVIELNYEMRVAASGLTGLSEADRSAKIAELKAAKEKKMSELLTPEQLLAVKNFYQEMGKNREVKTAN
jgi:Spy/CpxP family protein refolding chaperone